MSFPKISVWHYTIPIGIGASENHIFLFQYLFSIQSRFSCLSLNWHEVWSSLAPYCPPASFFSALASALCPIVKSQVSLCHFIYISVPRKLMSDLLSVPWLSSLFASSFRRSVYTSFFLVTFACVRGWKKTKQNKN